MKRLFSVAFVAVIACSCGGAESGSSPSPVAQLAGTWFGTLTVRSATGGDCVGPTLQPSIGTSTNGTLTIAQNGAALAGTYTQSGTGLSCTYTGTAGEISVVLNSTSCQAGTLVGLRCSNGALRDTRLVGSSLNATIVSGRGMTGSYAETDNVTINGSGAAAGLLTIQGTFTADRR